MRIVRGILPYFSKKTLGIRVCLDDDAHIVSSCVRC